MFEHCCLNIVICTMKLEEAIKQTKPFKSDYQKALVNLMYTHNWVNKDMKSHFKKFGITSKQYNILRILKGAQKPVSTLFVKDRLVESQSDVSRIVDRMLSKELISKQVCRNDKRLVDIELSAKGEELLNEVQVEQDFLNKIFKNLSSNEINQLNTLLDKIRH